MSPSYETISSGMPHIPVFVCKVVVGSHSFQGSEAKTKKQAEMNAAKVAYCTLTESKNLIVCVDLSIIVFVPWLYK